MGFFETFIISIGSAVLLDLLVEGLRYLRKSKCKLKLEYNDPSKSETEIVKLNTDK